MVEISMEVSEDFVSDLVESGRGDDRKIYLVRTLISFGLRYSHTIILSMSINAKLALDFSHLIKTL